jgi:hypothetical protein
MELHVSTRWFNFLQMWFYTCVHILIYIFEPVELHLCSHVDLYFCICGSTSLHFAQVELNSSTREITCVDTIQYAHTHWTVNFQCSLDYLFYFANGYWIGRKMIITSEVLTWMKCMLEWNHHLQITHIYYSQMNVIFDYLNRFFMGVCSVFIQILKTKVLI